MAKAFDIHSTVYYTLDRASVNRVTAQVQSALNGIQLPPAFGANFNRSLASINKTSALLSQTMARLGTSIANVATSTQSYAANAGRASAATAYFGAQTNKAWKSSLSYSYTIGALSARISALYAVYKNASSGVAFQAQLADIASTVETTTANVQPLGDSILKTASTLGVARDELVKVAETLTQAGFSVKQTKELIDPIGRLALTPTFKDLDIASRSIILLREAFKLKEANEFGDALERINRLSNTTAADATQIADGLSRAGASLAATRNSLNDTLALLATGIAATGGRPGSEIGNALKTITARMSSAENQAKVKSLLGVDVAPNGIQRSVVSVVRELARVQKNFRPGDVKFSAGLEALSGKFQLNVLRALISSVDELEKNLNEVGKAGDSVSLAVSNSQRTLQNAFGRTRGELQTLFNAIAKDQHFVGLTENVLSLTTALAKLTANLGPAIPALTAFLGVSAANAALPALLNRRFALGVGAAAIGGSLLSGSSNRGVGVLSGALTGGATGAAGFLVNPLVGGVTTAGGAVLGAASGFSAAGRKAIEDEQAARLSLVGRSAVHSDSGNRVRTTAALARELTTQLDSFNPTVTDSSSYKIAQEKFIAGNQDYVETLKVAQQQLIRQSKSTYEYYTKQDKAGVAINQALEALTGQSQKGLVEAQFKLRNAVDKTTKFQIEEAATLHETNAALKRYAQGIDRIIAARGNVIESGTIINALASERAGLGVTDQFAHAQERGDLFAVNQGLATGLNPRDAINPFALGGKARDLQARKFALEDAVGRTDAKDTTTLTSLSTRLRIVNDEYDRTTKALRALSSQTELAAEAQLRKNRFDASDAARGNLAAAFLGSDQQGRQQLLTDLENARQAFLAKSVDFGGNVEQQQSALRGFNASGNIILPGTKVTGDEALQALLKSSAVTRDFFKLTPQEVKDRAANDARLRKEIDRRIDAEREMFALASAELNKSFDAFGTSVTQLDNVLKQGTAALNSSADKFKEVFQSLPERIEFGGEMKPVRVDVVGLEVIRSLEPIIQKAISDAVQKSTVGRFSSSKADTANFQRRTQA